MSLLEIPNEIIQSILAYLPKRSRGRLCLTCRKGYQLFLPILYQHIEIGHRTQIKQLEQGILKNSYLKSVIQTYTRAITLKCRQGGNSHWLAGLLFEQLPNVEHLYFCDFPALSITKVRQMVSMMPQIVSLHFQYCDLVTTNDVTIRDPLLNIKELCLLWTDFSAEAIHHLLSHLPVLHRVVLGANHNRQPSANDGSLNSLVQLCPDVCDLSVSLQQVKEGTLCRAIQQYGPQLEHLSIRCQGSETLQTISWYTKRLRHLVIRCSNSTGPDSVIHVLRQCRSLIHLEMVSWLLHDMPSIVLDLIRDGHTPEHFQPPPSTLSILENIERTVAFDRQDLQKIRRLCLY